MQSRSDRVPEATVPILAGVLPGPSGTSAVACRRANPQTVGMVVARIGAAAAVLSAGAAVAVAGRIMALPREQSLSFPPSSFDAPSFVAGCGLLGLIWAITGGVLVALRPRNALGWLVLAVGTSQAWAVGLTAYGGYRLQEAGPSWPAYLGPALYMAGWLVPPTLLLVLYPDGRLPGPRWRWPAIAAAVSIVLLAACIPLPVIAPDQAHGWAMVPAFPQRLGDVLLPHKPTYEIRIFVPEVTAAGTPVVGSWWPVWTRFAAWVCKPLLGLAMLAIWIGTVVRLVRSQPPRRPQLAWLVCLVMPFLAALFAPVQVANVLVLLSLALVPVAVAVGVLRYRLLGIEAVLRRGLVYGIVTAAVVGAYLAVTAVAGTVLDSRLLPGVVVAALVAVALAPARTRLQRAVDRLIYGERRDPLRALTSLGQRVAVTDELELVPGALASVMAAVHAPGASLAAPDGRILASLGAAPGDDDRTAVLPLRFGGQRVGELRVAPRRPGESYTPADARLLAALALQVAVVVRAHGLTQELQAERDRVLEATKTERDRLREDLHDGLGPSLSGIGLGLQALADTPGGADPAATVLLDRIRAEVSLAFAEVRRIIDGLRPTALDTMELPDAIRRHAQTLSAAVPVRVEATELPPLPAPVETAAYRITTEALTNAARHADARQVLVSLTAPDGSLRITVADDGSGANTAAATGIGLTSMRRRAETLGGHLHIDSAASGTTITATLPLDPP